MAEPGVYARHLKRPLDLMSASVALVVLLPLLLLVAGAILLEDGGPVVFRQTRVGRDGRPFTLWKFRSMPVATGDMPSTAAVTVPITRVGRVIRRANIDELLQLFNILAGEMSLVGPRPALPMQEELITLRRENGSLGCHPGLTGLAQVNAFDGMTPSQKAAWDARYAARICFLADLSIGLRTVGYLFRRPPVY